MARDANGNYTLPAGNPVAAGTVISTTWANPTLTDIAQALTDSLSRNGDGGMLVAFENVDGNVALPGITWTLEPSTGLYREANNDMQAGVAGSRVTRWFNDTATPNGEQNPFQIWDGLVWRDALRDNHFGPINFQGDVTVGGTLGVTGAATFSGAVAINSNNFVQTAATPSYNFIESDTTDENAQLILASGSFRFRTIDDSGLNPVERMRIDQGTGDVSFYDTAGTTAKLVWDASAEMLTTSGLTVEDATTAVMTLSDTSSANQYSTFSQTGGNLVIESSNNGARGTFKIASADGTDSINRMYVATDGSVSFYEDTGTTAKMVWDASAESLDIGAPYPITGLRGARRLVLNGDGTEGVDFVAYASSNGIVDEEYIGGYLFGNDDNNVTEDHFAGMWANAEGAQGSMTLRFAAGKDNYENDTPQMIINGAGNLGLGTSTPTAYTGYTTLALNGSSGGELDLMVGGTNKGALFSSASSIVLQSTSGSNLPLVFRTNSVERMTLDTSGAVGIGTSNPDTTLHLQTPSGTKSEINFAQTAVTNYRIGVPASTDALVFTYGASTERMRIDSSGNLGLGMTPSAWSNAHIIDFESSDVGAQASVGDFGGQATLGQNFYFGPTGYTRKETGYASRFYQYQSSFVWQSIGTAAGGSNIAWDTKMLLDTSGNLLVGKTNTSETIAGGLIRSSGAMVQGLDGTGAADFHDFYRGTAGSLTRVGNIRSSGTTVAYNTSSDYRLKEDDVPMTGATERVKALRPINFAWKLDGSRTDGFFAHEAQEVVPEAVHGTKDAMRDEEYEVTPAVEEVRDEDGTVTTEAVEAVMGTRSVPDYQGIDQSKLVPLLTATIQELIARIEALEGA